MNQTFGLLIENHPANYATIFTLLFKQYHLYVHYDNIDIDDITYEIKNNIFCTLLTNITNNDIESYIETTNIDNYDYIIGELYDDICTEQFINGYVCVTFDKFLDIKFKVKKLQNINIGFVDGCNYLIYINQQNNIPLETIINYTKYISHLYEANRINSVNNNVIAKKCCK